MPFQVRWKIIDLGWLWRSVLQRKLYWL